MDIQDLRVLTSVIDCGGVTSASKRIHRTPASLTCRIMNLEEEFGLPLFTRKNKAMQPTAKAIELYQYAQKILHLADEAKTCMVAKEPTGTLRIGSMESTIINRLTPIFSRMKQLYPKLDLAVKFGNSGALYDSLLMDELDAIFVADIHYGYDSDTFGEAVFEENLVLVAPGFVKKIPEELPRLVAVMDRTCSYRKRLLRWLGEKELKKHKIVDFNSNNAILCTVAAGQGFAFVPKKLLEYFPYKELLNTFELPAEISLVKTDLIWKGSEEDPKIRALRTSVKSLQSVV